MGGLLYGDGCREHYVSVQNEIVCLHKDVLHALSVLSFMMMRASQLCSFVCTFRISSMMHTLHSVGSCLVDLGIVCIPKIIYISDRL